MTQADTDRFFVRAIDLARQAAGGVSPRPPVGAVIVKDGSIVGEGMTEPRPGLHAEAAAIQAAGGAARGATMYCTLEPHAHQGAAPPCTEEIISAGIKTLVCPIEDPNPKVNGNGFRRLRSAGVEIVRDVSPELHEQAADIVSGFATLLALGRPQFTLKYAMSLDGRIATPGGESQWITGEEARAEAHRMRRMSDAVITGIGTVLADNPRMTARNADGSATGRPRLRVVLDTHGRMPRDAALLHEKGKVLWILGEGAKHQSLEDLSDRVEAVELPAVDGRPDIKALAELLGEHDCCDALVEAGGGLAGALTASGLVDRIAAFIGPVVIGGERGPGPVAGQGIKRLKDAIKIERLRQRQLGSDLLITGRVVRTGD